MDKVPYIELALFEDEMFYKANYEYVVHYASLRVRGIRKTAAFRRVFGAANCGDIQGLYARIENLEASDTYNDTFDTILKSMPVDQMLSEKRALQGYLDIFHNEMLKESVRVAALKEACVLAGITTIDDAGRTRKVPTMEDMYGDPKPGDESTGEALH